MRLNTLSKERFACRRGRRWARQLWTCRCWRLAHWLDLTRSEIRRTDDGQRAHGRDSKTAEWITATFTRHATSNDKAFDGQGHAQERRNQPVLVDLADI